MGFCGIISLYRDDLIDRIDTLDITVFQLLLVNFQAKESNLKLAIESAKELGIPVTLTPSDILQNSSRNDAENKIKKFIGQLYHYFEVQKKVEATPSTSSNSNETPQFKTLDEGSSIFHQNF